MTKPPLDKTPPDNIVHPLHPGKYLNIVWTMAQHRHGSVWTMSGTCLDNVWTLFGLCLVYIWTVPMQCHDIVSTKSTLSLDNL